MNRPPLVRSSVANYSARRTGSCSVISSAFTITRRVGRGAEDHARVRHRCRDEVDAVVLGHGDRGGPVRVGPARHRHALGVELALGRLRERRAPEVEADAERGGHIDLPGLDGGTIAGRTVVTGLARPRCRMR